MHFAGVMFAAIALLELVTTLVSGTTFNAIYSATLHILSGGFVFLVVAAMSCVCFLLVM